MNLGKFELGVKDTLYLALEKIDANKKGFLICKSLSRVTF